MEAIISVKLKGSEIFFGNGIAELLAHVETTGSLSMACEAMNMAYSKAWRIIKRAEKELGFSLVIRKVGGSGGGGSCLTKEGKDFFQAYTAFRNEIEALAQKTFNKYF